MEKLIITAALTGAELSRQENPNLPISPEEIAGEAKRCWDAGASIIHIHARQPDGTPTQDKEIYREIIQAIQQRSDAIVQVSTGGAVGMSPEERVQPVTLAPEMATLTTGSVNFGQGVFHNPPEMIRHFARKMIDCGVKPEIEVFDSGMIANALSLVKEGLLSHPLHFDFVLGVPGGMPGTPENLMFLRHLLPPDATWTMAGIGRAELPLAVMALVLGGHVRVGFEDNIYYSKGVLAQSNAQLVERVVRIAGELNRPVATPSEAREILSMGRS